MRVISWCHNSGFSVKSQNLKELDKEEENYKLYFPKNAQMKKLSYQKLYEINQILQFYVRHRYI